MSQLPRTGKKRPIFLRRGDIARCLGIRPSTAKYKAMANLWDLLQALYCTYHGPNPLCCAAVAQDFRRHCTVGTTLWYLLSLEHDVDAML